MHRNIFQAPQTTKLLHGLSIDSAAQSSYRGLSFVLFRWKLAIIDYFHNSPSYIYLEYRLLIIFTILHRTFTWSIDYWLFSQFSIEHLLGVSIIDYFHNSPLCIYLEYRLLIIFTILYLIFFARLEKLQRSGVQPAERLAVRQPWQFIYLCSYNSFIYNVVTIYFYLPTVTMYVVTVHCNISIYHIYIYIYLFYPVSFNKDYFILKLKISYSNMLIN